MPKSIAVKMPRQERSCFRCLAKLSKGTRIAIIGRVSSSTQAKTDNPQDQIREIQKYAESIGLIVVKTFVVVAPGRDPKWIKKIANGARKRGVVLVAESMDRFIRHPQFKHNHPVKCKLQAREEDIQKLLKYTDGVKLATMLNPNWSNERVRKHQSERGQKNKGGVGGRPAKLITGYHERFRILYPIALALVTDKAVPIHKLHDHPKIKRTCEKHALAPVSMKTFYNWFNESKS